MEVRTLGPGDLALMRGMLAMFGTAFAEPDTYTGRQPPDDYLAGLLANPHFIAVAALDGSTVAGGLAAYVLPKFEQARSEVYIYDLAVAESHRRRGIATAMIRHAGEIAAARGAWVMFVQADYVDEPAVALYSKLGVRDEVLHFDLGLPGGTRPGTARE